MNAIIRRAMDKASERYAAKDSVRAAVASVPYIGNAVDILLGGRANAIIQERIALLFKELTVQLQEVQESCIDADFIESEAFFDLIIRAVDASSRTRHESKIAHYAAILRSAVQKQEREEYSPEEFLSVLADLSETEVQIVALIYKHDNAKDPEYDESKKLHLAHAVVTWFPGILYSEAQFHLGRITAAGLIHEETGALIGYAGGSYVVSQRLKDIVEYITVGPRQGKRDLPWWR